MPLNICCVEKISFVKSFIYLKNNYQNTCGIYKCILPLYCQVLSNYVSIRRAKGSDRTCKKKFTILFSLLGFAYYQIDGKGTRKTDRLFAGSAD